MEFLIVFVESLVECGLIFYIVEEVFVYILSNFESVDEVKVVFEKIGLLD